MTMRVAPLPLLRPTLMLLASLAAAADPPPVPDPLGLGERLALIDLLQETYAIHPGAGETLAQLKQRYAAAWRAAQAAAQTPEQRAEVERGERMARLRRLIDERFGQAADPALDEDGLIALLQRLKDEARERAAAAAPADDTAAERRPAARAATAPPSPPVARPPGDPVPARGSAATAKHVPFAAEGVSDCSFWSDGPRALLVVTFGEDHNGAFAGIPEHTWSIVSQAKTPHRVVALLGHGNGTGIARSSIEDHLRANRGFYETLGGQLPARKVDCLLFGSCSAHNPDQMAIMRDGLGYYPTWKVAAGARSAMNGVVFFAALNAIIDLPATTPFRGFFRFASPEHDVSSVGEVGIDGERAEVSIWTVERSAGGWTTTRRP
jgi:hypothetical protein